MVTARNSCLSDVPRSDPNQFNSVSRRQPGGDTSYTPCRGDRALSAEHYATIDDSATTFRGQDYQDIDELIRPDEPYLTPMEYGSSSATGGVRSSDLMDTNDTDTDSCHVYVSPRPTKR